MSAKPRVIFPVRDIETQYIGAMTISSFLKSHGYEVEAVEAEERALAEKLRDGRPTVLAYTTPTVFVLDYLELNRRLKARFAFFSLFGGWHPTYTPQMVEEEGVDAICVGEGEYATLELVQALERGESPRAIRNLWVKEGGQIHKNPLRPLIEDLDALPYPDRSFLFRKASSYYEVIASIVTQRSCPFSCSYCVNNAYNRLYDNPGRKRRRSVDNVIGELRQIKAKGHLEFVKFEDSIFITHPEWIREFAPKYAREIGVPFTCFARGELCTPEILTQLKQAGCASISMGVECGDDEMRRTLLNKHITSEQIVAAARMIKAHGIGIRTHSILGLPGCTIEDDFKTLALNVRCKPDYAADGLLQPYPGTQIYEYARERGLIEPDLQEFLRGLPTSYTDSAVRFKSPMEKRMAQNLVRLFPIGVGNPWLVPLIRQLIKLPPNPVFKWVYTGWKAWCYFFKVWPISTRNIWVLIKRYKKLS
jgi:radical SAM superfamily enzyme YgiQ (UPF0313 family)